MDIVKANHAVLRIFVLLVSICFLPYDLSAAVLVNSADYASLSAAIDAASGKTLAIARTEILNQNTTVPANVHLMFFNGGIITKSSISTIIINGPVTAPITQIFGGFSPGDIAFSGRIEQVFPQWWGAKGDSVTDDRIAIQCAIESKSPCVFLPKGNYLLNSALNLTALTNRELRVVGAGHSGAGGSYLIGNTSGIVLDATGSCNVQLQNFAIISGNSTPSVIGILYGRSGATADYANNSILDISVELNSIQVANNGNGTVAVYNYGAGLWRAHNVNLEADIDIVLTKSNIISVSSPFQNFSTTISRVAACTIDGTSILKGGKGPCVLFDGAEDIEFVNTRFSGDSTISSPFSYVFRVVSPSSGIFVTGYKDRSGGWMCLENAVIQDLKIQAAGTCTTPALHLTDTATVKNSEISICADDSETAIDLINAAGSNGEIRNVVFNLYKKQRINAASRLFKGNTIKTAMTMMEAAGSIRTRSDSSYILVTGDGIATKP